MNKSTWRRQSGMVGLEIVLLALVLAVAGFVAYRVVLSRSAASTTSVTTAATPTSKIEQTKQALSAAATEEATASEKFDESTSADISSTEEGMGDSYDVNF